MSAEDREAIRRLKHEYCYLIDDGDYEEWVDLFTDDGQFSLGETTFAGHDELYEFATERFDSVYETTAHVVSNPLIDVEGDEATGRWYLMLAYRTPDGEVGWKQTTYEDEYRKVDGEWKIVSSASIANIEN